MYPPVVPGFSTEPTLSFKTTDSGKPRYACPNNPPVKGAIYMFKYPFLYPPDPPGHELWSGVMLLAVLLASLTPLMLDELI